MKTIALEAAQKLVEEGYAASPSTRRQLAHERLRELVGYVREHSRYFQKAYANIPEQYQLSDLPVTTKAGLMKDYGAWVTDPEITLEGVREYLSDVENVKRDYLGRYTALATSGTTGTPMPMVRDSCHNVIHGALMSQRLLKGLDPKDTDPLHTRTASVIATGGFVSSYASAMRVKGKLGEHSDNFLLLSLLLPIDEIVEKLNEHDPKFLTSYASELMILAREKEKGRLKIEPKVIASSAEKLSPDMYKSLRDIFNCSVLNNYCSTEGGEIAMSCPQGNLHLNDDWILLEPVDDDFNPVEPGQWSSGALITDLSNFVQPVIRYHVGDSIMISKEACACGCNLPVIEISGRAGDMLITGDKALSFPVLYLWFGKVAGLLRWQAIQTGENTLEVRFFEKSGENREAIGADIKNVLSQSLSEYGCPDVEIVISDEDFIKTKTGKVPYTINAKRC